MAEKLIPPAIAAQGLVDGVQALWSERWRRVAKSSGCETQITAQQVKREANILLCTDERGEQHRVHVDNFPAFRAESVRKLGRTPRKLAIAEKVGSRG